MLPRMMTTQASRTSNACRLYQGSGDCLPSSPSGGGEENWVLVLLRHFPLQLRHVVLIIAHVAPSLAELGSAAPRCRARSRPHHLPDRMKVYAPEPDSRFGTSPSAYPPSPRLAAPDRLPTRPSVANRAATKALSPNTASSASSGDRSLRPQRRSDLIPQPMTQDPEHKQPPPERWVTKRQLADHLSVTPRWIELQQSLGLPRLSTGGMSRYRISEVEAWLRERYGSPSKTPQTRSR
jgi:hypothetical protein